MVTSLSPSLCSTFDLSLKIEGYGLGYVDDDYLELQLGKARSGEGERFFEQIPRTWPTVSGKPDIRESEEHPSPLRLKDGERELVSVFFII